MKILHTSDWHLGRSLYGRKRYEEFEAFLNWLAETLQDQQVDTLLIAGDVFDSSAPSHRAQELYYRFLCRVAASSCRHVVVTAGNHDSPSFLNAPKELLRALDVHVFGAIAENPEDEVMLLKNKADVPELIVCAVPYLRDRDIRCAEAGETLEDKERKLLEGIRAHYLQVCEWAERQREAFGVDIPIVAMGHLFAAGGATADGDGVRELYIGSLAHVATNIFPPCIDYLALGHLHVPQRVNNSDVMRYSGAPLPMGFGEAGQQKSVCLVEFDGRKAAVELIEVPVFQRLERLCGDWEKIHARLVELAAIGESIWLEIVYEGDELIGDLNERLEALIAGTELVILRVKNNRIVDRVLQRIHSDETLDDLNAEEVFERCLAAHQIAEEQRPELLQAYKETLTSLYQDDAMAE